MCRTEEDSFFVWDLIMLNALICVVDVVISTTTPMAKQVTVVRKLLRVAPRRNLSLALLHTCQPTSWTEVQSCGGSQTPGHHHWYQSWGRTESRQSCLRPRKRNAADHRKEWHLGRDRCDPVNKKSYILGDLRKKKVTNILTDLICLKECLNVRSLMRTELHFMVASM